MPVKVICIGLGRTGTVSLKAALEVLGFGPCYHMQDVIGNSQRIAQWITASKDDAEGKAVDWAEIFAGYRASTYWPAIAFWRQIIDYYPSAKVILTTRDPERWYASARGTIFRSELMSRTPPGRLLVGMSSVTSPEIRQMRHMIRETVWHPVFDGKLADRTRAIAAFERHTREVHAYVPAGRLLGYDIADGWGPLCAFLGVPVPGLPFPRQNDAATFQRSQARQVMGGLWRTVRAAATARTSGQAARR